MKVNVRTVKAALRSVWAQCQATNPAGSLRAALQAKSDAQFSVVGAGPIKETSANGQRTMLDTSSGENPSMQDLLEAWVYLVDLFDASSTELVNAGTANPTDTQVEAQMETHLRPVFGQTSNWMYLAK